MSAPPAILDLVARFEQQSETYQSGAFNETQLRRDFLDPLFKALGWDMDNEAGCAEAYRDVIHEDAIRIGGAVKAPDYCFRIGGTRKFFLEAKKPSVDIRADISPAYQLRRYAWSAKLPLSILSDFEELAVYDCRVKPAKNDPASTARVFYCAFRELAGKWDWLVSIFSRDAVLKGSFDKFAETNKAKRGTAEVDEDFLASMGTWRNDLAKNLALRNPRLSQRELNFAAQRILDPVAQLRILDPACGSGSFLICAYQFLLDWHLQFYLANDPEKWARGKPPALVQTTRGWRLTIGERKRILLNSIFGVDIDPQAVEVTKLSLLLKVLEGETSQSIQSLFTFLRQRALPDLGDNIKCGNSLIGPDFYQQTELPMLTDDEKLRLNVFDWPAEFPQIFRRRKSTGELREPATDSSDYTMPGVPLHGSYSYKKAKAEKLVPAPVAIESEWEGGFDAVIGNPPYVRQESLSDLKKYFESHYEAFDGVADLYTYFMERGVKLLRQGGLFSIIVSSSFLRATYGESLRRTLKRHASVVRIADFGGLAVFANAKDTYVCIPLLQKGGKQARVEVAKVDRLDFTNLAEYVSQHRFTIPSERLSVEAWALKSDEEAAVFAKIIEAGTPLGDYVQAKIFYGLKTGLNEAFEVTSAQRAAMIRASASSKPLIKRFLGGQDIRRYRIEDKERFLIVIPCGWTRQQMAKVGKGSGQASEREAWAWLQKEHPGIANHSEAFTDALKKRQDQGEFWWELRPCDYYDHMDEPKIIFPDICKAPRFFLDTEGIYLANTAYCLGTDDRYLLGVLNSRLFWFAISNISIPFGVRAGQYRYRLIYQYMEKVPIRVLDLSLASERIAHDQMVSLVEQMLALHRQLASARTPHEQTALERQIAATDPQIDHFVYQLYGLSEGNCSGQPRMNANGH